MSNEAAEPKPAAEPAVPVAAPVPAAATAVIAPRPNVVEFHQVSKTYGEGPKAYTAIKDVSFVVDDKPDRGEFIAILGPSGCGKSTILRMIAGLTPQFPATTGTVRVFGKPVSSAGPDRGMVFQDYTSFDHLTVVDNIAFGLECRGVALAERREQALAWIARVGLDPAKDAGKFPHQLSGGMRQRVAIARTLILKPRIILMDEPFGALDPGTRYAMQDLLISLWREQQATVFFITHSIEEAVYLGDRVLIMSRAPGTILHQLPLPHPDRPAKEMQREPAFIEEVFRIRDIVDELEDAKA
ncbi:MAG: ABC transporter ATP-binding protein [Xanthomonadales bacterium]|nr:Taurine import ATP-binding protein TauB [Xanthomonadales bacterium]MCC6593542.1 ABC transporter ATP-binding protein [Xanthomonadales bacterium]MCE7930991.1 ABC transporter ATP-binding protein [Xanthomonadales bacterium PRO6]